MDFVEVLVQGITLGCAYAIVALGFVLVFKATSVLNLAYGAIIMLLSYLLAFFSTTHGWPLWLCLIALFPISAFICMIIERFTIRKLIGRPFLASLVLTLALGLVLSGIIVLVWGGQSFSYRFLPVGGIKLGEIIVMPAGAWAFVAAVAVFAIMWLFFRYTSIGLAMRVTAASHPVAQSLGIIVRRIFSLSWMMSGLVATVGALLMGSLFVVDLGLGDYSLATGLPVLLLGGMESIAGALVGGILMGVAVSVAGYFDMHSEIVPWLFMLFVLLVKPHGLFGQKRIERI